MSTKGLFIVLGWLWSATAMAGSPWDNLPAETEAVEAWFEQRVVPDLKARQQVAEAQVAARKLYFSGEIPFARGFPELVGTRWTSRGVLSGRLLAIDDRATNRAQERRLPELPDERLGQIRDVLTATHAAEEAADALERRLLVGVRAYLDEHSDLMSLLDRQTAGLETALANLETGATDEERAAQARHAAGLDAERKRLQELVQLFRDQAVVFDAPPLSVQPELNALSDADRSPWAAQRLEALFPLLQEQILAEARLALASWLADGRLQELQKVREELDDDSWSATQGGTADDVEVAKVQVEAATTRARVAQAAVEAMPEGSDDPLVAVRRSIAEVQAEIGALELERATDRLHAAEAAEAGDVDADAQADLSRAQAQGDREEAERLKQLGDQQAQDAAEILTRLAETRDRGTEAWSAVSELRGAYHKEDANTASRMEKTRQDLRQLESTSLLDNERPSGDDLYNEARAITNGLRDRVWSRLDDLDEAQAAAERALARVSSDREAITAFRGKLGTGPDNALDAQMKQALDDWSDALREELRAVDERVEAVSDGRDVTLHQLSASRELKNAIYPHITVEAARDDRAFLVKDATQEVALLFPMLGQVLRDTWTGIFALPGKLLDWNFLIGLVRGSFYTFVIVGAWWAIRANIDALIKVVLVQLRRLPSVQLRPIEMQALKDPTKKFTLAITDWVLASLLLWSLGGALAVLGLILLTYLQFAQYRTIVHGFELFAVPHPQKRPALRVMLPQVYDLTRNTLRYLALWYIARRFSWYLLVHVLAMDTWARMVRWVFGWVGVGLALYLLHTWEPVVRRRVARLHQGDNRLLKWLAEAPPFTWLQAPRTVISLVLLSLVALWDLLHRAASSREELGRLLNVVSRYQLVQSEEESQKIEPAPPELVEQIRNPSVDGGLYVRRPDQEKTICEAVSAWKKGNRRGMVVLVGDRGSGKGVTVQEALSQARRNGHDDPAHVFHIERRLTSRRSFLAWLAEALDLPEVPETPDEAIASIRKNAPKGIYVIEDIHLAFLKTVNGFGALQALTYILNGASEGRFWICTVHRPAWAYLSRLGALINTEVFRDVVVLNPLNEQQVRQLTMTRLEKAGYRADFSGMVRSNPLGGDPAVELERTINTYFRLLAEVSEGNPSVALDLFSRCLGRVGEEGVVAVNVHADMGVGILERVSETDLFALAAIRTQGFLDEPEIVSVTNLAPGTIRQTVKHLETLGLLEKVRSQVGISLSALPIVSRTLRRRRFIPWVI